MILTASAAAYSLLLVIWATMTPLDIVYRIGTSLPFKLVLILYIINNLLCLIQQAKASISACRLEIAPAGEISRRRGFQSVSGVREGRSLLTAAAQRLRRRGWSVLVNAETGCLAAVRGRFTPLATIVFHAALFLLPIGIFFGSILFVQAQLAVAEGESFTGERRAYAQVMPADRKSQLPPVSFRVEEIRPRFWRGKLLFTDLYANIAYPAERPKSRQAVRLNVPWRPALGTYMTLVGIGYAPLYRLEASGKGVVEEGFAKLNTFPPGIRDNFRTSAGDFKVDMAVFPDHRIVGGKLENRTLNLRRPAYHVRVAGPGEAELFQGGAKPDDRIELAPGLFLSFPELRYWGQFRIIWAPGVLFIWAAFWLGAITVAWRAFRYQKRLDVTIDAAGRIVAAGKAEYYKIFNDQWFLELLERLFDMPFERRSKSEAGLESDAFR